MPVSNADLVTPVDAAAPMPAAQARPALADLHLDVLSNPVELEAEWRALAALPRNSLNQGYDWCMAWWSAHGRSPLILRGRIDGRTIVILPLDISTSLGLRIAAMPGGRFNNFNTGLFSADFPEPSPEELRVIVESIREKLAGLSDILLIEALPSSWSVSRHPLAQLATGEHPTRSFQLPLLPDIDQTIRQLNAKTRNRRFRIQRRRLEAAGGFEHICPQSAPEQHALLDLFFEQKARRFATFGLPDVFQPAAVQTFLHGLADRTEDSRDGILSLHAIRLRGEHEGRIAAIAALSRKGGHVLCQFSSIDETLFPEASPGDLLFRLMIEQSIEEGATVFDFGLGDQAYKRSWCTQETVLHDILLPMTGKGRIAHPLLAAVARMKTVIKGNAMLYSIAQRLRTALGR